MAELAEALATVKPCSTPISLHYSQMVDVTVGSNPSPRLVLTSWKLLNLEVDPTIYAFESSIRGTN